MVKESLVNYISDSIKDNWSLSAFSDYGTDKVLTYGDVGSIIIDIHSKFKKIGLHRGDKVALCSHNSSNWSIIYLSVLTYGAVIVPILVDFTPEDIVFIVKDSGSKVLFVDESVFKGIAKHDIDFITNIFHTTSFKSLSGNTDLGSITNYEKISKENFNLDIIENDELASIIYTSGTTGFSKGVMIIHNSLSANVRYAIENMPLNPGDSILSFLPLAHVFGCLFDFLFPFTRGVYIRFLTQLPTPQVLLEALSEVKPRLILAVPLIVEKIYFKKVKPTIEKPIIKMLLATPIFSSIIKKSICKKLTNSFGGKFFMLIVGGSALNEEAEAFFKDIGFRITVGYGMTECAPLIGYAPPDKHVLRSCGHIVDTLEIKIDSDDPYNTVGEIMVKGENVMMGYYKNPKATSEALTKDGWFKTGDLGVIDKDGAIFIKGRSKNMLLGASGQNVYPEEIESKLNDMPYVLESLIVQRGEKLHILICPDTDLIKANNIKEKDIKDLFEQTRLEFNKIIPNYATISSVSVTDKEFERNATKKIKRFLYK